MSSCADNVEHPIGSWNDSARAASPHESSLLVRVFQRLQATLVSSEHLSNAPEFHVPVIAARHNHHPILGLHRSSDDSSDACSMCCWDCHERSPAVAGYEAHVPFVASSHQHALLCHVDHGVATSLRQVQCGDAAVGGRAEQVPHADSSVAAMAASDNEAPAVDERHVVGSLALRVKQLERAHGLHVGARQGQAEVQLVDAAKSCVVSDGNETAGGVEANFADGRGRDGSDGG
mmetsp:Transcript_42634/g.134236  ORF Transcript_42634/g.134236 Transcript_42634/m.134236 type:complete len:233 (+) Transcript_42634:153-851(+)